MNTEKLSADSFVMRENKKNIICSIDFGDISVVKLFIII